MKKRCLAQREFHFKTTIEHRSKIFALSTRVWRSVKSTPYIDSTADWLSPTLQFTLPCSSPSRFLCLPLYQSSPPHSSYPPPSPHHPLSSGFTSAHRLSACSCHPQPPTASNFSSSLLLFFFLLLLLLLLRVYASSRLLHLVVYPSFCSSVFPLLISSALAPSFFRFSLFTRSVSSLSFGVVRFPLLLVWCLPIAALISTRC